MNYEDIIKLKVRHTLYKVIMHYILTCLNTILMSAWSKLTEVDFLDWSSEQSFCWRHNAFFWRQVVDTMPDWFYKYNTSSKFKSRSTEPSIFRESHKN